MRKAALMGLICTIVIVCLSTCHSKSKNDLSCCIGTYEYDETFVRDNEEVSWHYLITIYKEKGDFFANIKMEDKTSPINIQAKIYGNEEWISLVLLKYLEKSITLSSDSMVNDVLISVLITA